MAKIQDRLAQSGRKIRLVSLSVDPDHDRPDVLAEYARGYRADPRIWTFLTGPVDEVKSAVVAGFKLPIGDAPPPGERKPSEAFEILHSERFVLIDGELQIRGYYDSDPAGVEKLMRDAIQLASPGDTRR